MARPRLTVPRRHARKPAAGPNPDRLYSCAIVHLGAAWRAHGDGDVLAAVRHLGRASECIAGLIERWTVEKETQT